MKQSVMERVIDVLTEVTCVTEREIVLLSRFVEDLGLDSLEVMEVVVSLEEEFGVDISDEVAATWSTVGDAVKWLEENSL